METKFRQCIAIGSIATCSIFVSCNGSADKKAAQKLKDSLEAIHHFDSMQNAIKAMQKQDSIDALKTADSTKKSDSVNAHK